MPTKYLPHQRLLAIFQRLFQVLLLPLPVFIAIFRFGAILGGMETQLLLKKFVVTVE